MAKLQQNISSAMGNVTEKANAIRTEVGEFLLVPEKSTEFRQLNTQSSEVDTIGVQCENTAEQEVTTTIDMVSVEVTEMKKKMEELLELLEKSQNNMEDVETEQEVEIHRMKMENENLKRDNWSLNETLKRLKNEDKMKLAIESMANQYHDQLIRLQDARVYSRPQMNNFNLLYENGMFVPDFTWKINGIQGLLEQDTFQIESQEFSWNEYPDLRVRAKLELRSNDWLYLSLSSKPNKIMNPLNFKLLPTVYYVLKDRSGSAEPEHNVQSAIGVFPFTQLDDYEDKIVHKSWLADPLYNTDNCVVLEVFVEPPEEAQRAHSTDGTLEWTVDNCLKRCEAESRFPLFCSQSPYFYTGPKGFRAQVWLWFNGIEDYRGIGLTLAVIFLAGEFDEDLPLEIPHRNTVTLVNRKHPERSITKTVDKIRDEHFYTIHICTYEEMLELYENDTLYFNIAIKLNE